MSDTTFHIPMLETERLILRAPQFSDLPFYAAFKASERSRFTGGPFDAEQARKSFSAVAGLWVLRGYGLFTAVLKTDTDTVIGGFGIFHPVNQQEPEFGWSLYAAEHEGKGFVTEAMRAVIPWAWDVMGVETAQSHIDEHNEASVKIAKALGATFDPETTKAANSPGGKFDDYGPFVNIWRHHKGALT